VDEISVEIPEPNIVLAPVGNLKKPIKQVI